MTQTGLQSVVTTNIKVLMAVTRIEAQKDLAAKLGWGESKLTKSLRGDRKWSLEDLPELAKVFGVQPADIIGDVTNLVNVAHPLKTGTDGVTARVTSEYVPGNTADVIQFPLLRKPRTGYYSKMIGRSSRPSRPQTRRTGHHPFAEAAV